MRPLILISVLAWAGCAANTEPQPPPTDRFVYPTGIVHRKVDGSEHGALYVASANFDKCFDSGAVTALDLDALGVPALGAPVGEEGPVQITQLGVSPTDSVQIASFAGEMDVWNPPEGSTRSPRLFVPTRAEGNFLHSIDITGKTMLGCVPVGGQDCTSTALSLTGDVEGAQEGLPRAPSPIGVSVTSVDPGTANERPEAWVTHAEAADSPIRSEQNYQTYVVRVRAPEQGDLLTLSRDDFFPMSSGGLAVGGTHAAAIGSRYVYVTGRSFTVGQSGTLGASFLLRLMDRTDPARILETGLRDVYQTLEARDVAINADETRIYVVARFPDTLLVVDIGDAGAARPSLSVVDAIPLPDGASALQVLRRADGSDLVVVTCSASSNTTTGIVAIYDSKLGQLVAQVDDVGRQPYGLAVDQRGNAARLYVTNFGDGRVAIIDLPNLDTPRDARLVAHLGQIQGRDEKQGTSTCQQQGAIP